MFVQIDAGEGGGAGDHEVQEARGARLLQEGARQQKLIFLDMNA